MTDAGQAGHGGQLTTWLSPVVQNRTMETVDGRRGAVSEESDSNPETIPVRLRDCLRASEAVHGPSSKEPALGAGQTCAAGV